jgi:hypothetical protein
VKRLADQTLYEILEVSFDATPAAIAEAVERARSLYGPGSLATYSLMSTEEAALLGRRIEEAQSTLLDPVARAHYDEVITRPEPAPAVRTGRGNGSAPAAWSVPPVFPALKAPTVAPSLAEPVRADGRADAEEPPHAHPTAPAARAPEPVPAAEPVFSAEPVPADDPVPVAEPVLAGEPAFAAEPVSPPEPAPAAAERPFCPPVAEASPRPVPILLSREVAPPPVSPPVSEAPASSPGVVFPLAPAPTPPPAPGPTPVPMVQPPAPPLPATDATAWSGEVLKQLREARGITLQQLAERTKVTRHHIENIEGDRYGHLPAAVYLRGILLSIARELRLDGQKVARSYLERVAGAAKPR